LASLQLRLAISDGAWQCRTARLVAAQQVTALGRRATAEHLLAAQELEDNISRAQSFPVTPH
jgi:hypothetical protein